MDGDGLNFYLTDRFIKSFGIKRKTGKIPKCRKSALPLPQYIDAAAAFEAWKEAQRDREALKRWRDELRADAVQRLVDEYLP